jgi:tetratricopeptide (TPR) repeat protein
VKRTLSNNGIREGSPIPAPPGPRHRLALAAALLLVGTLVAATHWPVLDAQAISLDDAPFVTQNPLVTHPSWESTSRFFREVLHPSTVKGYYLPLTMTSLMLDYAAGGRPEDLRVFHRTNLALHVLNTLLVLLLLYRLFGALIPATLAALLFGVHPLTVEPTAWVGERKTLLATFFAFSCLLTYLAYCRRRNGAWIVVSAALYLLGLLSKPTITMIPLLMLLLDGWPLNRLSRRALLEKWPFFVLSILLGVVTVVSHENTAGFAKVDYPPWPIHVGNLLAFYLGKVIWPRDLSCVYALPTPYSLSNPTVLVGVVAVTLFSAILILLARREKGPITGWLFFVVALAPTLGFVHYSWVVASDKYVYFPALGLLLLLASGLGAAWSSRRAGLAWRVATLLAVLLVAAADVRGTRTTLRNWSDSMTLYRNMERLAPDAPVVNAQFGVLLERASRYEEALVHLRRAVELEPNYPDAQYNLGVALAHQGRLEESVRHFRMADQGSPDDPETLYNLGLSLRLLGRLDEAAVEFRRALAVKPDYIEALDELGGLRVVQGHPDEGVVELRKALALAPANATLHHRLAVALLIDGGSASEAIEHLHKAIEGEPAWPAPYNALAWLRATSPDSTVRDTAEALRLGARASELTGGHDPRVLDTVAAAQAAAGRFSEAVRTQREAIAIVARAPGDTLARGMRERMNLYERGRPYREPPRAGATPAS